MYPETPNLKVGDLYTLFDKHELWRPVEGWPYEVSSWGRLKRTNSEEFIAQAFSGRYPHVTLSDGERRKTARTHLLVANAFLGQAPFEGAEVAHNDGRPANSRASNLRWASKIENQADRNRHGTDIRGSRTHGAKLNEDVIPTILQRIASGERYPSIAKDLGVSISTISLIKLGRTWRHAQTHEAA